MPVWLAAWGESMQESKELTSNAVDVPGIMRENLREIDAILAKENIPIRDRPLAALRKLLVLGAIMEEDGTPVNSDEKARTQSQWRKITWMFLVSASRIMAIAGHL